MTNSNSTANTNGDGEDHGRAASPASLVVIVDHQGSHSRLALPPSLSPSCLSTEELRNRIGRRLSLSRHEAFDIEWVDDDNNVSYISDDESLREALDFFTPSSAAVTSPTTSSSSSASPAPVELQVRIRLCTRISLSDSSGPSEVGKRSSSSASGSSAASSSSWWQTDEDEEEASSSQNGSSRSNGHSSGETWEYVRRAGDQTRTASKSSAASSNRPPLNGRQRMAAYTRRDAENEADSDDEEGTEYAYSVESSVPASLARCNSGSTTAVHRGIRCVACDTTPIRGPRYLCLVCPDGVSFCARCEDVGRAIQHGPHLATHALVKLVEAGGTMTGTGAGSSSSASMGASHEDIASTLIRAAQQLTIGRSANTNGLTVSATASSSSTRPPPPSSSASLLQTQLPQPPSPLAHDVLCSFCSEPIVGARFLCANCPLDLPTPDDSPVTTPNGDGDGEASSSSAPPQTVILTPHEGFNLCSSCEQHSLSIHDADHFFIRIPSPAALVGGGDGSGRSAPLPLRLNPYLTIRHRTEGLLPTLYRSDDLGWEEMKRAMKTEQGGMLTKVVSSSYADNAAIALGLAQAAQLGAGSSNTTTAATAVVAPRSRFFSRWCPTATTPTTSTPPASTTLDERTYVSSLVHPNIFCDVCFNVVEGFWMRCTSCPVSYDVCQDCATRGAVYEQHDRSHAFAVFKRAVDLDLFRSLVDHFGLPEGMADGPEPSHAMLPFPLV